MEERVAEGRKWLFESPGEGPRGRRRGKYKLGGKGIGRPEVGEGLTGR
jgi:hypothetical protein